MRDAFRADQLAEVFTLWRHRNTMVRVKVYGAWDHPDKSNNAERIAESALVSKGLRGAHFLGLFMGDACEPFEPVVTVDAPYVVPATRPVPKVYRHVTEFVGRASGDCECFCFDRRTVAEDERDSSLGKDGDFWSRENLEERMRRDDEARIYPDALLPEEAKVGPCGVSARRGRYRITIEFEPAVDEVEAPKEIGR